MDVRNILPFVALSPSTRRRNRGRGTVVFDDLTDETTMNSTDSIINTTDITPSALVDSLLLNPTPSPDELIIQARGRRRGVPLTFRYICGRLSSSFCEKSFHNRSLTL